MKRICVDLTDAKDNKEFNFFVASRCVVALSESATYMQMLGNEKDSSSLLVEGETLCYKKGFQDAIELILQGKISEK